MAVEGAEVVMAVEGVDVVDVVVVGSGHRRNTSTLSE